jgi:hypothetical protein
MPIAAVALLLALDPGLGLRPREALGVVAHHDRIAQHLGYEVEVAKREFTQDNPGASQEHRYSHMLPNEPRFSWNEAAGPPGDVVAASLHTGLRGQGRTPRRPALDNSGLDRHHRESQFCILTEDGEVLERRIRTTPERLPALLGGRPPARIRLEASTESEWVARHLETLGHTVIVADPNVAPM